VSDNPSLATRPDMAGNVNMSMSMNMNIT
jgi:hypothetical protein